MAITIVGLGPGDGRYLTREAWAVLQAAETLYIRTQFHPVVAELSGWQSFDAVYDGASNYEAVYQTITEQIIEQGRDGDVVYAVPGDPHVGEAAVLAIEQAARAHGIALRVVPGISFLEPTLAVLQLDAFDGLQVFDAMVIAQQLHPGVSADTPLLLGQVHNRLLASDIKLTLLAMYPPEHVVQLVHGAGTDTASVETLPLFEIDRSEQLHNLTSLYVPARERTSTLANLAETIAILRSPHGCPWDIEQTPQSIRGSLLEETAELVDALDRHDVANLQEELGDLLMLIVMQAQMASEAADFTISDVIAGIDAKIRRRHPHVWGDVQADDVDAVNAVWARAKAAEKQARGDGASPSILDGVPVALTSLARSYKLQKKARKIGFDWPNIDGVWAKLAEEIAELKEAESAEHQQEEFGDVLFVLVNLATWLKIDAEAAMRGANLKFIRRFQGVEQLMRDQHVTFDEVDLEFMENLWQDVKRREQA